MERPRKLRLDGRGSFLCPQRIPDRITTIATLYPRQPAFDQRLLYAARIPCPACLLDGAALLFRHSLVSRSSRVIACLAVSYLHGKFPHRLPARPGLFPRLVAVRG